MNIELTEISSGYNLSKINQNFSVLKNAVNTLLLHVDGTNELKADLDFNGFKALNLKGLVIDGRDIIEVIDEAYKEIDSFLQTTDNLLREIEAILSGQLQDRNQGNGQYSTQLTEAIEEGTTYIIPNGLQYIVGRNSLRISYQGVMCYPTYQYDEVGTFDEPSNKIKFNVTIPAYSQLNIWISGVGNIVQIKEDLEAAFAEYTEYVTNTKNEIDTIKESIDSSEANVTAIEASVKDSVVNLEQWNTESLEAASNSKIWAEGTDEEITPIGGTHSSKTWSLLAKEYAEAAEQIKQQIGTPLNVQGRVDDVQSLPSTGNKNGDMYFVGPESSDDLSEYVWINNKWEFLGVLDVTIPDASESEKGIVKLATQDEISARTGNSVVTASKLPTNIDWSKVDNKPVLAAVATSGDYNDLINIPSVIPAGLIALWSGSADAIPSGWALCDGNNGTPDLRDRFVVGAGLSQPVGAIGGAASQTATISGNTGATTLDINTLPSHGHAFSMSPMDRTSAPSPVPKTGDSPYMYASSTTTTGGSQPHAHSLSGSATVNVLPPYYALCYIMKQ